MDHFTGTPLQYECYFFNMSMFEVSCFATTCFKMKALPENYLFRFALCCYSLVILSLGQGTQILTCFEKFEQGRILGSAKMGCQGSRLQFQKQAHLIED